MSPIDRRRRPLKDLRISVTDRCNYRCSYCMPLDEYDWIEKNQILTFEEIARLTALFLKSGVDSVRLTGGEPLVRRNLEQLVVALSALPGLKDLSLTTNGSLLSEKAQALKKAGLNRVSVSLDTLIPDRFRQITQRGDLDVVLKGLFAAQKAGLGPIKINAVIIRGVNDDEILDLVRFSRENSLVIRFIEYMDVGNANGWSLEKTVTKKEIFDAIHSRFPLRERGRKEGRAPAIDYEFADGAGELGIIGSVTEPFCGTCTRARLTADGKLVTCLFAPQGYDLKSLMRTGATDDQLLDAITQIWSNRTDRYSEERWTSLTTQSYRPQKKIEMITLGG